MPRAKSDILQGWKEIASYLSRDMRTVRRWEAERSLPVRRTPGSGRANVFAVVSELDAWLSSLPLAAKNESDNQTGTSIAEDIQRPNEAATLPAALSMPAESSSSAEISQPGLSPRLKQAAVAVLVLVFACGGAMIFRHWRNLAQNRLVSPGGEPTEQSKTSIPYSSKVPGVNELCLQGVYFLEQRTPESLNLALERFLAAIQKDPGYAPAYSGLASTYDLLHEHSDMPANVAFAKAKAAAEKSIALNPNLPGGHAALGFAQFFGDWKAAQAERELRTAIDLDPNAALSRLWYGSVLTHEGRFPEAIEQLNIAARLQPSSTAILSSRAFAIGMGGRRNEGADLLQEIISQNRDTSSAHLRLAILSLIAPRDIPRFLEEARRYAELAHAPQQLRFLAVADRAFRHGGEKEMWRAFISDERRTRSGQPSWKVATAESALGDKDASFAELERLVQSHDPDMVAIEMEPLLRPLHSDPRFQKLEAEVGLPPIQ